MEDLSKAAAPLLVDGSDVETLGTFESWATFSRDRLYRYALGRMWDSSRAVLVVCMLNPSTATDTKLDPTLRRVRAFANRDHYGGFIVVNAFAYRATDRRQLRRVADPVGPHNDDAICAALNRPLMARAVAGWGRPDNKAIEHRCNQIRVLPARRPWHVFGPLTKGGHPRHPLYLKGDTQIVKWNR